MNILYKVDFVWSDLPQVARFVNIVFRKKFVRESRGNDLGHVTV